MDKTGDLQVKTCAHREHGTQVNVHTTVHADLTQTPKHKWMPHLVLFHLLSHVVHTLSHHTSSPPSPFPSPPRLACSGRQRRTQAAFTRRDSRELRARARQHHHRQEGIGDGVAWGEWCYEELEKERSGRREVKLEGGENMVC